MGTFQSSHAIMYQDIFLLVSMHEDTLQNHDQLTHFINVVGNIYYPQCSILPACPSITTSMFECFDGAWFAKACMENTH